MEHIHSPIHCLLCKWISPPMQPSAGPRRMLMVSSLCGGMHQSFSAMMLKPEQLLQKVKPLHLYCSARIYCVFFQWARLHLLHILSKRPSAFVGDSSRVHPQLFSFFCTFFKLTYFVSCMFFQRAHLHSLQILPVCPSAVAPRLSHTPAFICCRFFQRACLHLLQSWVGFQYKKLARPLKGGAVIVTVRCRMTALEQVVIRVAEV